MSVCLFVVPMSRAPHAIICGRKGKLLYSLLILIGNFCDSTIKLGFGLVKVGISMIGRYM